MSRYAPYRFRPGQTEALDTQFANAAVFSKIRMAEQGLFWKNGIYWHYIPLEGIQRIFRRREGRYGRLCAGGRNFIIEWLVLILANGSELVLHIGDDTEAAAVALMEALARSHPEIPYGKV